MSWTASALRPQWNTCRRRPYAHLNKKSTTTKSESQEEKSQILLFVSIFIALCIRRNPHSHDNGRRIPDAAAAYSQNVLLKHNHRRRSNECQPFARPATLALRRHQQHSDLWYSRQFSVIYFQPRLRCRFAQSAKSDKDGLRRSSYYMTLLWKRVLAPNEYQYHSDSPQPREHRNRVAAWDGAQEEKGWETHGEMENRCGCCTLFLWQRHWTLSMFSYHT